LTLLLTAARWSGQAAVRLPWGRLQASAHRASRQYAASDPSVRRSCAAHSPTSHSPTSRPPAAGHRLSLCGQQHISHYTLARDASARRKRPTMPSATGPHTRTPAPPHSGTPAENAPRATRPFPAPFP